MTTGLQWRLSILLSILVLLIACRERSASVQDPEEIQAMTGLRRDALGCYSLVDTSIVGDSSQLLLAFRAFQLDDGAPEGPGRFGLRPAVLAAPPAGTPAPVGIWSADSLSDTIRVVNFLTVASATLAIELRVGDTLAGVLYSLEEGNHQVKLIGSVRVRHTTCIR